MVPYTTHDELGTVSALAPLLYVSRRYISLSQHMGTMGRTAVRRTAVWAKAG
jgi:hypothetical protein